MERAREYQHAACVLVFGFRGGFLARIIRPSTNDTEKFRMLKKSQELEKAAWIPFGDHPLKLERYRED
jgi:hypothetical protein